MTTGAQNVGGRPPSCQEGGRPPWAGHGEGGVGEGGVGEGGVGEGGVEQAVHL